MDLGIKGKTAIICASSKGLGKACAVSLAQEGVNVILNGRNPSTLDMAAEEITRLAGSEVSVNTVCADGNRAQPPHSMLSGLSVRRQLLRARPMLHTRLPMVR